MFAARASVTSAAPVASPVSTVAPIASITAIASIISTALTAVPLTLIVTRRRSFLGLNAHFRITISHRSFAGETNTALFIDAETFHPDFVTHFDDVFGLFDPEIGEFTDVNEAVLAGQEFHKGAEVFDG